MYKIKTHNKISSDGLDILTHNKIEFSETTQEHDAILLRSYKLSQKDVTSNVKAIGRAGAGVNNIPLDYCTDKGVVVFNTPGANANAVKELLLTAILLSSRDIIGGLTFSDNIDSKTDDINSLVEKNKGLFKGTEILGKTIGVIGLGAIGMMVSNCAVSLGMKVYGYDPYITVNNAWGLSSQVQRSENIQQMISECDYITLHMPLTQNTKYFIDHKLLKKFKKHAVLLNFSRSEIVNEDDIIKALENGHLSRYATDFPSKKLLKNKQVFCFPHLGASTAEAENNCAIMIANQIADYLHNGNIHNSVNFPSCSAIRMGKSRLCIINKNIPNMVGQITGMIADEKLNIIELVNKSKNDIAYNIIDLEKKPPSRLIDNVLSIEGVLGVRVI